MVVRKLYNKMKTILEKINYGEIYPEFHMFPFALYNDDIILIDDREIPKTENFYGNTNIVFEGRQIAIWNVDFDVNECDSEYFAADLVHEMFHAFQHEKNLIKEYPSDLMILQYPDDLSNFMLKRQENLLLADVLTASIEEQKRVYDTVKASRELRKKNLDNYVLQEELCENLEGLAELSGCLALKQLNPEKFQRRLSSYAEQLKKENTDMFDIRRSSYYSGTILLYLERLVDNQESLISDLQHKYLNEKKDIIQSLLQKDHERIEVNTYICGYDPMNQFRFGDMLFAKNMIYLMLDGAPKIIEGPVILEMENDSPNMVKAYYSTCKESC